MHMTVLPEIGASPLPRYQLALGSSDAATRSGGRAQMAAG